MYRLVRLGVLLVLRRLGVLLRVLVLLLRVLVLPLRVLVLLLRVLVLPVRDFTERGMISCVTCSIFMVWRSKRSPDYGPNGRRKHSSDRTAYLHARLFTSMW